MHHLISDFYQVRSLHNSHKANTLSSNTAAHKGLLLPLGPKAKEVHPQVLRVAACHHHHTVAVRLLMLHHLRASIAPTVGKGHRHCSR